MRRIDVIRLGRKLYGERYITRLARELGVATRSVQRWVQEHNPITPPERLAVSMLPLIDRALDDLEEERELIMMEIDMNLLDEEDEED